MSALSPGEWAVLGLIAEEPRHGFALRKLMAADGEVGRVWSLPSPLVYRALATLQAKGMAEVAGAQRSELGPQRTLVRATAEGRGRLLDWLREPVEHMRDFRSQFMLKLALLYRSGGDPRPLVKAQRAHLWPVIAALEERAQASAGFEQALLAWRLESGRAALRFLDHLAAVHTRG